MTTVSLTERIEIALNISEGFKWQVDGKQLADLLLHLSEAQAELKKLPIHNVSSSIEDGNKRYCKGCYKDVTDNMWCECGETPLSLDSTASEAEAENMG